MKILIVDDHGLIREALHGFLQLLDSNSIIYEAESLEQAKTFTQENIDLILLDYWLPDADGHESIEQLRESYDSRIVLLSGESNPDLIEDCRNLDISGFIHKSSKSAVMINALKIILGGERYFPDHLVNIKSNAINNKLAVLTPRQREICEKAFKEELGNKQIACDLNISESTVKTTLSICYDKLSIKSRKEGKAIFQWIYFDKGN